VANSTNRFGVLFKHGKVAFDGFFTIFGFPSLAGFGESLLLAAVPALVVSTSDFIGKMSSPDGLDGSWSVGGINVTGDTNNLQWWSFDDADAFNNLLLVNC
jgi:hypothetical protein